MKLIRHTITCFAALSLLIAGCSPAEPETATESQPGASQPDDIAEPPPPPGELLRQMSEELKEAGTFQFHAEINFDRLLVSGQMLQYSGAADLTVRRPDGVTIDYRDDLSAKRFWYDGTTAALLDVVQEKYSRVDVPDDIDAAMDQLHERYGLTLPLADLISKDVFEGLEGRALSWGYVGVHDVEGILAHHIAIVGEETDLQIWIQKDGSPLPLKLVVTYKDVPMAPQYQAVLMDWELGAEIAADSFQARLPQDAQLVDFIVLEEGK